MMQQQQQQQREHLIHDGLNVPCQLAKEHGGQGLRYQNADGSAPASVLPRGYVVGVYPGHVGRQPSRYHEQLPVCMSGVLRDEYALQLSQCMLYAERGRRSAGAINEASWPNLAFCQICVDIDGNDNPQVSFLVLLTLRPVAPLRYFSVDYGGDFESTRHARGYSVTRLPGPKPRSFEPHEVESALRDAFTTEELRQLSSFAGVVDFGSAAGSRGDPNHFWGGPFGLSLQGSVQESWQQQVSSPQVRHQQFGPPPLRRHQWPWTCPSMHSTRPCTCTQCMSNACPIPVADH